MSISTKQFFQDNSLKNSYAQYSPSVEEVSSENLSSERFLAKRSRGEIFQGRFNIATARLTAYLALRPLLHCIPHLASMTGRISSTVSLVAAAPFSSIPAVASIASMAPTIILGLSLLHTLRKVIYLPVGFAVQPSGLVHDPKDADKTRTNAFSSLNNDGFITKRVCLSKGNLNFDAFLIGHVNNIHNGKWVINGLGNCQIAENELEEISRKNHDSYNMNTLLINGPGVGRSETCPTPYGIGSAYESAMQFLEKEVAAKKIVLKGYSLGGGGLSKAVNDHDFSYANQSGVRYLFVSDRTFDKLSNAAGEMVFKLASPIMKLLGYELASVNVAKKLQKENIKHIVIQATDRATDCTIPLDYTRSEVILDPKRSTFGDDGVIPGNASMAKGLKERGLTDGRQVTFLGSSRIHHNFPLPQNVEEELTSQINSFARS